MKPKNIFIGISFAGAAVYLAKTINAFILFNEQGETSPTVYGFILIELLAVAMPFYLIHKKMKVGLILLYIVGITNIGIILVESFDPEFPIYLLGALALFWILALGFFTFKRKELFDK